MINGGDTQEKLFNQRSGLPTASKSDIRMGGAPNNMSASSIKAWESKRTEETRDIEELLGETFEQADAYRYNSASIRVRVIDSSFEGMPREKRDSLVEEQLVKLPPETQRDIVTLLTFAPSEMLNAPTTFREFMQNREFDGPSPSIL